MTITTCPTLTIKYFKINTMLDMSIPLPSVDKKTDYSSKCDMYDGDAGTSGLCKGWITKTSHCTRRDDEMGKTCDGYGKFP